MTTIPQRYRQTDGQTICHGHTALCLASHSKNVKYSSRVLAKELAEYSISKLLGQYSPEASTSLSIDRER